MKKSLKHHLERLILLPYYPIWLYQNRRIQRLRKAINNLERWVAIADFNHGLAEESVKKYENLYRSADTLIHSQHKQLETYAELVKVHESRANNFESMIENYEKMVKILRNKFN